MTISASRQGLKEDLVGKLALIATELGTNLLKHGGGGEILLRPLNWDSRGFEILAVDKGPGISDWRRAFEDGFSTAGSPGTGLGAIARLATEHFCYAVPQRGTIIATRVRPAGGVSDEIHFEIGAICIPIPGETECGDSWTVMPGRGGNGTIRVVVADGLGHGPIAAEASQVAIQIAREYPTLSPCGLLERAHDDLRATRGAAMAVADIDRQNGVVQFCGLGNISAVLAAEGKLRQLVSHNGTAGLHYRRVQEFQYPWTRSSMLLMHSDGLATRWSLDRYPGITAQHACIAGAALYRDHTRGRDDVTVVTVREKSPAT